MLNLQQRIVCVFLVLCINIDGFAQKKLSLEDIHDSLVFSGETFQRGRWASTGPVIRFIHPSENGASADLMSFNLETKAQEQLIDGTQLYAPDVQRVLEIEDYQYSENGQRVLLYTDSERVWRQNTKGYYYVYNLAKNDLMPISDRGKGFQMFAKFNPKADQIAFVRDRNLYLVDLTTGKETALTTDGAAGSIINGTSDWVYEEEFGLRDGWSWSPDGRFIAFFKFDESETRDFFMTDLLQQYPEAERFRYPKAGEKNSEVQIGVISISSGNLRYFDTDTWFEGGEQHEYIPMMGWTPAIEGEHKVWMIRMNRDQNKLDLLYGDPESAEVDVVLQEEEPTWIDVGNNIRYLGDGKHFIWMSETDGYRHLYLHTNDGRRVRQITQGDWEVITVNGIDEREGIVYFTGTLASPLQRHLYSIRYKGRNVNRATPQKITGRPGIHSIDLSTDAQFYIDRYSNTTTPIVVSLHRINGERIDVLESNEELIEKLADYEPAVPEFITVPGADDTPLNAYLIKPKTFDPSAEYPLLMYVYGGPGSQTVSDRWGGSRYLWHAMLADELNIIIASVDNRGTGARGKVFKSSTYRQLGKLESADQIAAARYLGGLDYVDAERMGIWGWSYGGYMTLMSMLTGAGPETFKFGMSVAPVTDWRQYDTIYTERYMSTPQHNEVGYSEGAPIKHAGNLQDHQRLLLVHGDFDDNVHFQNIAQMADALQAANKQFEIMMYPGRNHGISGGKTRLHLFTLLTRFVKDALNEPTLVEAEN